MIKLVAGSHPPGNRLCLEFIKIYSRNILRRIAAQKNTCSSFRGQMLGIPIDELVARDRTGVAFTVQAGHA
jgi:hypothetical protein